MLSLYGELRLHSRRASNPDLIKMQQGIVLSPLPSLPQLLLQRHVLPPHFIYYHALLSEHAPTLVLPHQPDIKKQLEPENATPRIISFSVHPSLEEI